MPLDKKGKFHLNTQMAMASDRMGANMHKQSGERAKGVGDPMPGGKSDASEADDRGAEAHMREMHHASGARTSHMIHQHHDGTFTTHHVGEDGQHDGPHDHENLDALKDHMNRYLDEERDEAYDDGEEKAEHEPAMSGY